MQFSNKGRLGQISNSQKSFTPSWNPFYIFDKINWQNNIEKNAKTVKIPI